MAATILRPLRFASRRCSFQPLLRSSPPPRLHPTAAVAARGFAASARTNELIKKFTEDHEWIALDTGSSTPDIATIGITKYAANSLGDVVYVELPTVPMTVAAGETLGAVESVKSASDILSPVTGEVVEANQALADKPGLINQSPEDDAWVVKVQLSDKAELDGLMDATAYDAFTTH